MRMRRPLLPFGLSWPVLMTAAGVVALLAADAFARAGGGGRFNDGGGGGGGSGGGGSGGGAILYLLINLAFRYPLIGVPLLILFIVVFVIGGKKANRGHQGRTIRRGIDADATHREQETQNRLRKHDPHFDEARFLQRVQRSFLTLQSAWCEHDLDPIRPFVSDGLHARFELQIEEQRLLGYRDRMDAVNIERTWFVETHVEGPFEVVTVRIRANAVDYRVDLLSGKPIEPTTPPETFVEYWSFVRRKGAQTKDGDGLMEGNCPNCGAAIERTQWSHCAYCDALLRSGEHDWVLTEITQASQWSERDYAPPAGVTQLTTRDPGFGLQHLEDRASLLFWHWRTAVMHGDVKPLGGAFTETATADVQTDLADDTDAEGVRHYTGECAVGHVTVAGVLSDATHDRALVDVVWSGTAFSRRTGAQPERGGMRPARCTLLVLLRPRGAQSGLDDAFSSAHCAGCGAPESVDDRGQCNYCGEATDGGHAGWSVDRVLPSLSEESRQMKSALRVEGVPTDEFNPLANRTHEPLVKAEILSWMAQVAAVDGVIAPKERASLDALARKTGVKLTEVERLVRSSSARNQAEKLGPRDAREARLWLGAAARTALADGEVSAAEQALLERLVAEFGLLPADVRLVVNEERRALFHKAKKSLRNLRS